MIYHGDIPVKEIILHTSATPADWWKGKTIFEMRDEIDRWHQERGWREIGYHYVVAPDGSAAMGRAPHEVGAHVKGHNVGTIGICMVNTRDHDGIKRFQDYFTEQQRLKVKQIIAILREKGVERVSGHNNYSPKECPGFWVKSQEWLEPDKPSFWARVFEWLMKWVRRPG